MRLTRVVFTSELVIDSPSSEIVTSLWEKSYETENLIHRTYSVFNPESSVNKRLLPGDIDIVHNSQYHHCILEYSKSRGVIDFTSALKGYFMREIFSPEIIESNEDFLIDFGGDIIFRGTQTINIEGTDRSIFLRGLKAVFTSGNTYKRGNHIPGGRTNSTKTIVFLDPSIYLLPDYDAYTTLRYARLVPVNRGYKTKEIDIVYE